MYLIGLTGGIASGKTAVAKRLAEHGAIHIDADQLAREVVAPGTRGLAAIVERFGEGVLLADGSLNRAALGAIIFADDGARLDLNAITHPAVGRLGKQLIADVATRDQHAVVVYDVPLLIEASKQPDYYQFDLVVVVEAGADERVRRMVKLRGMTEEEARRRVASQSTDEERREIADVIIDGNGSLDDTMREADELWASVVSRA
ncbi:MAG TPA: dephospho-CoA kinase [Galbitalea sp.]|nr:dephospho-CoA kinase [Galbitalea sp.]